jgi:two-component system, chemotaxis family, CheB/CheR fusion protein
MVPSNADTPGQMGGGDAPRSVTKPRIVGIGASAGGIQALQTFFHALPERLGAAFVVVVHLDPESHSDLASILAAQTQMPVTQVHGTVPLEADHVYVIPPNRRLQITDHDVSAVEFDEPRGQRAPIDSFFRSLAAQHGDGFAVILTGSGTDGTIGVKAIKESGGIILVQDPEDAEHPSMPRSAIATGLADFVLPLSDLAGHLSELIRDGEKLSIEGIPRGDEELVTRILAHVRVRTGHDFSSYKRSTVMRRIARRIQITRSKDLSDYYAFLREQGEEAQSLVNDLLISVTTFFRDGEVFKALGSQVVPLLFEGKDANDAVRIWVPGCATGEEAYSIGMLLLEEMTKRDIRPRVQVFGTDLDNVALAAAREGRYPTAIEADVSEDRLHRFFTREGDHYRVKRELRELAIFAFHSVLRDPPFSRMDLISCRNLLIYLDRGLQEQVCGTFHYALNPGGFLLVGSSETADNPPGLFRAIDRKNRIYQSSAMAGERPRLLPRLLGSLRVHEYHVQSPTRMSTSAGAVSEAAAHRQAPEKIAPPSILVDESHRVVHLSDHAGRYLQPAGGPLSGDLAELVREELRFEIRAALHRAFEERESTVSIPIPVRFNGLPHRVYFQVKPIIQGRDEPPRQAVVLFMEGEPVEEMPLANLSGGNEGVVSEVVQRLTQELQATQTRLRTTREESEAANEELRAANEELQSINEEYRSTSEELETSKEELQSINEELQTVNNELKLKLEAVSRANSDLQNLMAATDFGTLFLDSGLRIKRFTEHVTDLFNITHNDEGRPITDFSNQLEYQGLAEDARTVIADLAPIRREVRSQDQRWYDIRLRPYRTVDDKIDGVVISFIDVTDRRKTEDALRESEERLRQEMRLVELSREPIFVWNLDDGIVEWNRGSEELYGWTRNEALGRNNEELLKSDVPESSFAEVKKELIKSGNWSGELRQKTKDGRNLVVETRMELRPQGDRRLVLESTRDITERKRWESRQETILRELTHRVKNMLAVVQAMAHQSMEGSPSKEEFIERFDGRLTALSEAHNLLVAANWRGAEIGELARKQLKPYAGARLDRIRMEGDPIILPADLATPFGLVLHELATNAAKHGALSTSKGTVSLTWALNSRNNPPLLTVLWEEKGGPPVSKPKTTGLGSALITGGIPNARVEYEFRRHGVVCKIELPFPIRATDPD